MRRLTRNRSRRVSWHGSLRMRVKLWAHHRHRCAGLRKVRVLGRGFHDVQCLCTPTYIAKALYNFYAKKYIGELCPSRDSTSQSNCGPFGSIIPVPGSGAQHINMAHPSDTVADVTSSLEALLLTSGDGRDSIAATRAVGVPDPRHGRQSDVDARPTVPNTVCSLFDVNPHARTRTHTHTLKNTHRTLTPVCARGCRKVPFLKMVG